MHIYACMHECIYQCITPAEYIYIYIYVYIYIYIVEAFGLCRRSEVSKLPPGLDQDGPEQDWAPK